jgi:hypothetical protein
VAEYKLRLGVEAEVLSMLICYVMNRCPLLAFVISDYLPSSNSFKVESYIFVLSIIDIDYQELSFVGLQQALKNAHDFVCNMVCFTAVLCSVN